MIRQAVVSFFLSFTAVLLMFILYVALPQYFAEYYSRVRVRATEDQIKLSTFSRFVMPTPTPNPSPTPDLTPATLIIPKLDIQAAVEPVGITETNNMDVPQNASNVAWYMFGPKPRELGNAVISGHYDTPTGKPAIFFKLGELEVGDEVEVISENAVRSIFVVSEVATIPRDEFPSEHVFKSKEGKNLNLITCGGVWDTKKKTYTDRIVVYTTLKESNLGNSI